MEQSPKPIESKIFAEQGTISTGGPVIQGKAGAVKGEAMVTVEDKNGKQDEKKAAADGSFRFTDLNLQEGFSCRRNDTIMVSQKVSGSLDSDAIPITVD